MPVRVQLSRKKGWKLPPNTVVVARPSKWGDPFKVGPDCTAAEAVKKYGAILDGHGQQPVHIQTLAGKNLACWCRLDQPCHADELLKRANLGVQPCESKMI